MSGELPLQVYGLVAPVLCWVEGSEGYRLPETWMGGELTVEDRERAWLTRELPTYSQDSLDEIRHLDRDREEGIDRQTATRRLLSGRRSAMSPPEGYDLQMVFEELSQRYFQWSGNELAIRSERLVELHELALRFPVRHLIRYRHARAVAHGVLTADRALELPEQMGRLHTTSQGIRAVVERGLTEGHLHLGGVTSADEGWADHLLRKISGEDLEGFGREEQRLLTLSRAAVRLLALALLHARLASHLENLAGRRASDLEAPLDHLGPTAHEVFVDLLELLDRLYLAGSQRAELEARRKLRNQMRHHLPRQWPLVDRLRNVDRETDWLLDLLDPRMSFIRRLGQRRSVSAGSGLRHRLRLLERLHFEVERTLVEMAAVGRRRERSRRLGPGQREELRGFLHDAFYRYLIYHTHYWHLAIQSGRTTGLREFVQFYNAPQRWPLTSRVEERGWILESLGRHDGLHAVEARVGPPKEAADLVPWILGQWRPTRDESAAGVPGLGWRRPKKFGIIVHFIKKSYPEDVHPSRRGPGGPRHGAIRRMTRFRAMELFRLLSTCHPVVPFIVGIDAANLELAAPPEVFAPTFRFLREFPIELRRRTPVAEYLSSFGEISRLVAARRLGLTYHVGEDFRHLLSGLRAIAEVIEFLRPYPGDRLGHAIALALEPEVWMSQIGYQAVLPRQEWLDTLVWVHHLLGAGHDLLGELDVEHEIQRLSREVYGQAALRSRQETEAELHGDSEGEWGSGFRRGPVTLDIPRQLDWSPSTLFDAWRLRQLDPYSLKLGRPDRPEDRLLPPSSMSPEDQRWHRVQRRSMDEVDRELGSDDAYRFLQWYWFDGGVREAGDKIISVDMQRWRGRWLQLFREVQSKVLRRVQREQLVVEVNPSSNRVIGPMARFADLPIFRLTLDDDGRPSREVRVTVNTDDPGVFNTSLAHEYYLLAEIQLQRGVPEARVVEWLEWLRKNGEDYSFLRTLPQLDDRRVDALLRSLEQTHRTLLGRLAGRQRGLSSVDLGGRSASRVDSQLPRSSFGLPAGPAGLAGSGRPTR